MFTPQSKGIAWYEPCEPCRGWMPKYLDFLNPPFQHVPFQWYLGQRRGLRKSIGTPSGRWGRIWQDGMRSIDSHWWSIHVEPPIEQPWAAMLGKCTCINYRWISMVYYIILLFQTLGRFFHQQHHSHGIQSIHTCQFLCADIQEILYQLPSVINTHQGPKDRLVWSPQGAQFKCQVAKRGSVQSQVGGSKDSDWYQTWVHGEKKTTTPFR